MPRATTPSFVTEIPLKTNSKQQAILRKRFWAAKQQYNALLGEALKRLNAMRADKRFEQAKNLYKQKGKKQEAKKLFKQLEKDYSYREYDLYKYCKQWNKKEDKYQRGTCLKNKKTSSLSIGSRISQKLAKRAFQAVEEYKKGIRGRPRYKGYKGINSIEDNSIDANLVLKDKTLHYLKLKLPLCYKPQDPIHYHGLNSPIKYVRLVKRNFNTGTRYFVQLICQGFPWIKSKNQAQKAIIGLDIGPQTIAIVSPEKSYADIQVFADELKCEKKQRKKLQQKIARQLRANNPTCYEPFTWEKKDKHYYKKQGKSIKGKRPLNRSKALQKTTAKLASMARRQAAYRKTQHGNLVNKILRIGHHIKTEKLSYKVLQTIWKSHRTKPSRMFVALGKRKAENAGGKVEEINTYKTKLSQSCHCGRQHKKPLAQRWHRCSCGVEGQGDLYSAYLASFVENDILIANQAQKAWPGMDIALRTAMSKIKRSSSGLLPASLGLKDPGFDRYLRAVS